MTGQPSLFPDLPPAPPPVKLSADRRRTLRQRAFLDAGIHPATREKLAGNGETCGSCVHCVDHFAGGHGWVRKCDVSRLGKSSSASSDIRVSWPACARWAGLCDPRPASDA